jgi:hypothetical protein
MRLVMTTDRINYLNIGLMVATAVAAFVWPFEVFLLSYAVLGPLHYLTEISWLHDRNYFLEGKRDYLHFVFLCTLVLVVSLTQWPPAWKNEIRTLIYYTAFAGAAALLVARTTATRAVAFASIGLSFFVMAQSAMFRVVFGVFLPTIIHVFLFTGAFILLGALRDRTKSAIAALAVLAISAMSFFIFSPAGLNYHVSEYVRRAYSSFEVVNLLMINSFNLAPVGTRDVVYSSAGLTVMRFIAFAYLYHYLNWFSKTSIIKWNRISRGRALSIIALWIGSLCIYASDSRVGFAVMTSVSILHGFLELPLDHRAFFNIGKEVLALTGLTRSAQSDPRLAIAKNTIATN